MKYSHQPHTKGGQTKPGRRSAQKSTLTTADLITNKKAFIARVEAELMEAVRADDTLWILEAKAVLKHLREGLATLEAMQAEEAGR